MSADAGLEAFAYGEHLEQGQGRSLGFRLLIPEVSQSWSAEVETLARRLQSAPFPDHWTTTDLFCSVLLADGQRLVALARYGLEGSYFRQTSRRARVDGGCRSKNPQRYSDAGHLSMVTRAGQQWMQCPISPASSIWLSPGRSSSPAADGDLVPVLPIRMWQERALLFAATTAADPDLRLGLLEHNTSPHWQWLPFTGAVIFLWRPTRKEARSSPGHRI